VIRLTIIFSLLIALSACDETQSEAMGVPDRVTRVTVTSPQQRQINYVLTALGSVESIHDPTISAETSGQIVSIDTAEGDAVVAGQQLAGLDNTLHNIEAAKAEAELQRQSVVLENQRKEVARLQRLAKSQSVSQDQLEDQQAELSMLEAKRNVARQERQRAQYMESKTRVVAPQAGQISRRHISLGDYVIPGTPLFDLVSVDRLRARLAFPERNASDISIGKEVQLVSPAAPDAVAVGEVTSINPQIRVLSRAIEVTVEFDNPGGWLPGASVDATLVVKNKPDALTISPSSIVTRDDREVVFVVSNGEVETRPVVTGWAEVEWVEILSGLAAGDQVVVEGVGLISDGSLVEVVD
jgi:membrane fusion protein, multidrug efflux system